MSYMVKLLRCVAHRFPRVCFFLHLIMQWLVCHVTRIISDHLIKVVADSRCFHCKLVLVFKVIKYFVGDTYVNIPFLIKIWFTCFSIHWFFFLIYFIDDIWQCFKCTARWFNYTYIIFGIIFFIIAYYKIFIDYSYLCLWASLVAPLVKNPPVMRDLVQLGQRSPGEGKATQSSILAWRIPWTV